MGLSILKFPYEGTNDFDLNFALGYSSKTDIDCYVDGEFPIDVEFDWLTDSRVRIVDTDLELGDTVVFTRTVDKSNLPVNLIADGGLTRENVETAVTHSLYAMHELLDGRFSDVVDTSDLVFNTVTDAVTTALSNFLFQATMKRDIVLHPTFTEAATETYTSGDAYCDAADVQVTLLTNPAVTTEYLVMNGDNVVFSITFDSSGEEVSRSTTQIDLTAGSISTDVTGSNYVSGADMWIVFPMKTLAQVDFETALSDYVETFNTEFNA